MLLLRASKRLKASFGQNEFELAKLFHVNELSRRSSSSLQSLWVWPPKQEQLYPAFAAHSKFKWDLFRKTWSFWKRLLKKFYFRQKGHRHIHLKKRNSSKKHKNNSLKKLVGTVPSITNLNANSLNINPERHPRRFEKRTLSQMIVFFLYEVHL